MRNLLYGPMFQEKLTRAIWCLAVAISCAAAWMGFSIFSANGSSADLAQGLAGQRKRITDLEAVVAEGKGLEGVEAAQGMGAISSFQSALESLASVRGCHVDEFQSARNLAAYLSKFEKETGDPNWSQVEVKTQITGRARDVFSLLDALKDVGIPFEYCSIEISRQVVLNPVDSRVAASIELNILVPTEGGA